MAFATLSDLQTRFGAQEILLLADRDNDGVLDAGVVEAALADADAEIVSYIGQAVSVDAGDPPVVLTRLACDLVRYRLFGANPTDDARKRYEDAVAFLRRVRNGDATLDAGASAPTDPQPPSLAAASCPGDRVFKRGL